MTYAFMIDGVAVEPQAANVSVLDRGFLYGDSVFETIRTYGGRPFALEHHLERLAESARRVLIALPVSLEQFAAEVLSALELVRRPESYIRVMLTRGVGQTLGLDPDLAQQPRRIIITAPLVPPSKETYERGITAVTYRTQRVAEATDAAGSKIGNYLTAVLATRAAKLAGASEALIVDHQDRVLEGATSNVYTVIRGAIVTAPAETGILLGITRHHLLELARELGLSIEERAVTMAELQAAEEVFISSSIREVMAVTQVDGQPVNSGTPGPIQARLRAEFRVRARASVGLSG